MRIGFDAKRAFFNRTGLGNYSRSIIQGFSKHFPQEDYFLFSPQLKDPTSFTFSPFAHHIDLGPVLVGSFNRVFGMERLLREHDLDIFHGLSNELPFGGKTSTKLVVSIHDLLFLRYPSFYPWLDRQIYLRKTRWSCERADLVIAMSEQTKQDLIHFLNIPEQKIKVHYQACHPQFSLPVSEKQILSVKEKYGIRAPYILQVGTLEPRKNALLTLQAFLQSALSREFHLVLLGNETPYCKLLHEFVAEHGLEKRVQLIHHSHFEDFPSLYAGAQFSVYPSLFEGFGIPILESLTVDVPVITSKDGCFKEVGGEAALYIDAYSAEDLATQMDRLAHDSTLRQELIVKGQKQIKKFSEYVLFQELHKIYQTLLLQKSPL